VDRNLAIKKKAQQLIQKGQIDAALAEFDKLFDSGDKDPYDFILVADLLAKRGSMQEAVRRYRQAVEEYSKGELFKNAIAVCKKILRISKEDLQIHRSLGDLYAKEGLYGDAQIHYLEYAEGSIRRQEFEPALDVIDMVLSLSPDNEELSEKYVEISMRGDLPERGGKELLRRADRAEQAGRRAVAQELRERASTLAPGLGPTSAGSVDAAKAVTETTATSGFGDAPAAVADVPQASPSDGPAGPIEPGVVSLDGTPVAMPDATPSRATMEPGVVSLSDEPVEPAEPAAPAEPPRAAFVAPPTPVPAAPAAPVAETPPAVAAPLAPAEDPGAITFESSEPEPPPPAAEPEPASGIAFDLAPEEAAAPSHEEVAASHLKAGRTDLAAEEYWKAAELVFFRGDVARARALLEQLLQVAPQHEAALRRLVDITAQEGDRAAEARVRFELAEVHLAQEEWAVARAEYLRVLEIDGSNDRARMRVQRLDALLNAPPPPGADVDFDAIDVPKPAASVRVRDESPAPSNGEGLIDLEEIIDEFKQGVQNSISGEDHESHYDLGMAYMEMGLYDEAIAEFEIAQKGGPMELKSLEMVALCYLEKNEPADAVRELTRALEVPGHGPDETISIRYNLGMAHERLGNLDRALQHYEEVHVLNVDFLKVATKVRELKQRLSGSRNLG
jgi:tetratricopeptide (TPR) repeat protein